MTSKPTVYVDGQPVAVGTAAAFKKLAAAFQAATGYSLHVTSGYRTYAQQLSLWRRWKGLEKPPFYAPSVAYPGTSLHESGGALDVHDSGSSPGVTTAGNTRSNWLKANATKYGFKPIGYSFNEPWHIEYQGNYWVVPTPTPKPSEEDEMTPEEKKQLKEVHAALTSGDGKSMAARVRNVQDILTGYVGNTYVQKGYSLPRLIALVTDGTGTGAGVRARNNQDLLTGGGPYGEKPSLLRQILEGQQEIKVRLDALEAKVK